MKKFVNLVATSLNDTLHFSWVDIVVVFKISSISFFPDFLQDERRHESEAKMFHKSFSVNREDH